MGKIYDEIDGSLRKLIGEQKMFFVATAPLAVDGHVNLSPKGLDSFRVIDSKTVAYADLIGSGIETVSHLKENRRIALMFCTMEGAPKILRLHGQGEVIEPGHPDFPHLGEVFPEFDGLRCFIRVKCDRISDSCGFGVPLYEFKGHRSQLEAWAKSKGVEKLSDYQRDNNAVSIDGLPGISLDENDSNE